MSAEELGCVGVPMKLLEKKMPIELPSTVIYANPPDGGLSSADSNWECRYSTVPKHVLQIIRIKEAAQNLTLNGRAVWAAAETCDNFLVMNEVFKGLSGQARFAVETQLKMHAQVQAYAVSSYRPNKFRNAYYVGDGCGRVAEGDYGKMLNNNQLRHIEGVLPRSTIDFYGSPVMPIAAIAYWLFGGGEDRNVNIGSLNLQMVLSDFKPITDVLNNPATVSGCYAIDAPFSYNTFSKAPINLPVAGVFGRVNGNVSGTLVINSDNTYSFTGHYMLNKDTYDADESNRSYWQEALTTFLRGLGDTFGRTDYTINIIGTQPVVFFGRK
ncbi:lipid II-degrading bacteriocin [Pseudomonas syringae USA007]|uniref:Lipid II-degrading bacteriocin n=1 Tax=Pseudomonas syringae USA007 TaxID=1357288 RepID=A0AAU8MDZ7_PSESX|nr:lipid II-degrading bacteriocin [Pseudomonas syringae]